MRDPNKSALCSAWSGRAGWGNRRVNLGNERNLGWIALMGELGGMGKKEPASNYSRGRWSHIMLSATRSRPRHVGTAYPDSNPRVTSVTRLVRKAGDEIRTRDFNLGRVALYH